MDVSDGVESAAAAAAAAAAEAAAKEAAAVRLRDSAAKGELSRWSVLALRHQLTAMGVAGGGSGLDQPALVDSYWQALVASGTQHDEARRRFLIAPSESDVPSLVRLWVSAVIGRPLPEDDTQLLGALRSGELLCDLINELRPGIVRRVTRYDEAMAMAENKRNAKLRENVGQYIDGCAELGLPSRELFMTADLFDGKDFRAVLRNVEGLSRLAQYAVPGFVGPFVGKRVVNAGPRPAHGRVPTAAPPSECAATTILPSPEHLVAASYAFSSSSASFFAAPVIDGAHTIPQPRVSALLQ